MPKHTTDPAQPQYDALKGTYYWQDGLYVFNWNCVGGCFIVLVLILIDSSLIQPFCDALGAVKPHRRPLIACFFVLYYILGQLVVLNVVVAFILDAFMEAQAQTEARGKQSKEDTGGGSGDEAEGGGGSLGTGATALQRADEQQRRVLPVAPERPGVV